MFFLKMYLMNRWTYKSELTMIDLPTSWPGPCCYAIVARNPVPLAVRPNVGPNATAAWPESNAVAGHDGGNETPGNA